MMDRDIGRLVISAILRRDDPVVQDVVLVTAAAYVLINLVVDMIYVFIDPRPRAVARPPAPELERRRGRGNLLPLPARGRRGGT
jgi:hypothetical protein